MDRVTILLGAGFSGAFGMPNTARLTRLAIRQATPTIPQLRNAPAAQVLTQALEREYGSHNFELMLHAIETLSSYAAVDTYSDDLSSVRQVLRAFTEPSARTAPLVNFDMLRRLRRAIISAIVRRIDLAGRERRPRVHAATAALFNKLSDLTPNLGPAVMARSQAT